MKRVVCYGDSNTWGYNPATSMRYPRDEQWPSVMQKELGDGYEVIDEGLNGRTTVWEDPIEEYKCGKDYIIPCIKTHQPFDLLIILLGTNDLKKRFSLSAYDIAEGARTLIRLARSTQDVHGGTSPEILLLAPPPMEQPTEYAAMFEGAVEKSRLFGKEFSRVSSEESCHFLDCGRHVRSSPVDGIHLDSDELPKLGLAVATKVKDILG